MQGDNKHVRDFIETFDSIDVRTQKNLIDWMGQYPSLSQQRESGESVVEQLQNKYPHLGSSQRVDRRGRPL